MGEPQEPRSTPRHQSRSLGPRLHFEPTRLAPEPRYGLIISRQVEVASSHLKYTTVNKASEPLSLPYPSIRYCKPLCRRHIGQGSVQGAVMLSDVAETVQILKHLLCVGSDDALRRLQDTLATYGEMAALVWAVWPVGFAQPRRGPG